MPAAQSNNSTYIAAAAVAISFAGGLWGLVNPRGDLAAIKQDFALYATKELHSQDIAHLSSEFRRMESEISALRSIAVPRELFSWKVDQLERIQTVQRERLQKIDETVNVTYSAKDALQQMQNRLTELERAARGAASK